MKPVFRYYFCLLLCYWLILGSPAEAMTLCSENIARSAYSTAVATHTVGRCYAAVSRALSPMGVQLSGEAAYQARALLLQDSRFAPLGFYGIDELMRGDIVVYSRSATHPYGHIAVYEGHDEEASDHLAPVTPTKAYGSAVVFRLRLLQFPPLAPPFTRAPAPAPQYQADRSCDFLQRDMQQSPAEMSRHGPGRKYWKFPLALLRKLRPYYSAFAGQSRLIRLLY